MKPNFTISDARILPALNTLLDGMAFSYNGTIYMKMAVSLYRPSENYCLCFNLQTAKVEELPVNIAVDSEITAVLSIAYN